MTVPAVPPDGDGGDPDRPQVVPDRDTILWNGQEWVPVSAYEALLAKLVSAGPGPEPQTPEQRAVEAIARSLHASKWCRCGDPAKPLLCLEAGIPVVTALRSLAETDPDAWAEVAGAAVGVLGVRVVCTSCGCTVALPYTDQAEATATKRGEVTKMQARVSIERLDGWTAPPLLCPDCSKAQP